MKRFLTCLCLSCFFYNATFAFSFDFGSSISKSISGAKNSFSKSFSGFTSSLDSIKSTFSQAQSIQKNVQQQFDSVKGQIDGLKGVKDQLLGQVTDQLDGYKAELGKFSALGDTITESIKEDFESTLGKATQGLQDAQQTINDSTEGIVKIKQEKSALETKRDEIQGKLATAQKQQDEYTKKDAALEQAITAARQDMDEQWEQVRSSAVQNGYGDLVPEISTQTQEQTIQPIASIWKQLTARIVATPASPTVNIAPIINAVAPASSSVQPVAEPAILPELNIDLDDNNEFGEGFLSAYEIQKAKNKEDIKAFEQKVSTAQKEKDQALTKIKKTNDEIKKQEESLATANKKLTPQLNAKQEQINEMEENIATTTKAISTLKKQKLACKDVACKSSIDVSIVGVEKASKDLTKLKTKLNDEFKDITDSDPALQTQYEALQDLKKKKETEEKEIDKAQENISAAQKEENDKKLEQAQVLAEKAETLEEKKEAIDKVIVATNNALETETDPKTKSELEQQGAEASKEYKQVKKSVLDDRITKSAKKIEDLENKINKEPDETKRKELEREKEKIENDTNYLKKAQAAQNLEEELDQLGDQKTEDQKDLQNKIHNQQKIEEEIEDLEKQRKAIQESMKICEGQNMAGCKEGYEKALKDNNKLIEEKKAALETAEKEREVAQEKFDAVKKLIREKQTELSTYQCEYQDASQKGNNANDGEKIYTSSGYCVQLQTPIGKTVSVRGQNGIDLFSQYVGIIYRYAASIVGIIAVLVIVVSGIQISLAGFNSEFSSQAKTRIMQSLASLILLFAIGMILKTVNPTFFDRSSAEELENLPGLNQPINQGGTGAAGLGGEGGEYGGYQAGSGSVAGSIRSKHEDPNKFIPKYGSSAYSESSVYRSASDPYGAGAISHGKGDRGGVSYGTYQFESKGGSNPTINRFINDPNNPYRNQFKGLTPNTTAFNDKWKELSKTDNKAFGQAQEGFLEKDSQKQINTFYRQAGISSAQQKDPVVRDFAMGTINQYGGGGARSVATAIKNSGSTNSRSGIINAGQTHKKNNVNINFRSSSQAVKNGVAKRIERERKIWLSQQ